MRVTRCEAIPYRLTFAAAPRAEAPRQRAGWWLRLEDERGRTGWGEAACWPGFGSDPLAVEAVLPSLAPPARPLETVAQVAAWADRLSAVPEARHAAELAALDLLGQELGLPLGRLLDPDGPDPEPVPIQRLVRDAADARAAAAAGWRALKLKVGDAPLVDDLARVARVRAAVGPDVRLVVDANGRWSRAAGLRAAAALAGAVDALEQPLAPADVAGHAALRGEGRPAVWWDEGLRSEATLARVIAAGAADGVVLKPMACGGPTRTRAWARRARVAGATVSLSHLFASAVGRAAALHLAAAFAPGQPAGLAPPFADDVAEVAASPLAPPPDRPGLGVTPVPLAARSRS